MNISNPYVSLNNNSHRVEGTHEIKIANPTMKNYVTPYSQYPQSNVQPRLSKTIPYEEEYNKKAATENHQISGHIQYRDVIKPDVQTKRTLNRYETLPTVTTPPVEETTKRVPRFS
jgi:hypothetical protein